MIAETVLRSLGLGRVSDDLLWLKRSPHWVLPAFAGNVILRKALITD